MQKLALGIGVLKATIMLNLEIILSARVFCVKERRHNTCPSAVVGWLWLNMLAYSGG